MGKKLQLPAKLAEARQWTEQGCLSLAIALINEAKSECGIMFNDPDFEAAQATYKSLLHYFGEGMADPQRSAVYEGVKEAVVRHLDRCDYFLNAKETDTRYFSLARTHLSRPNAVEQRLKSVLTARRAVQLDEEAGGYNVQLHSEMEYELTGLFEALWAKQFLSKSEESQLLEAAAGSDYESLQYIIVGALFMGSLEYLDSSKLRLLLHIYLEAKADGVKARALVCAILLTERYADRIAANKKLVELMEAVKESEGFEEGFRESALNLIRTRDTERINKNIQEIFIPEIKKIRLDIERKLGEMAETATDNPEELNPEWEALLKESGLDEKMQRITELQMEGGDIFMEAFAKMKEFPFFYKEANWFLPFDASRSEIHAIGSDLPAGMMDMLAPNQLFCNTDKYSFALALCRLPEAQKAMMNEQISAQMGQFDELKKSSLSPSDSSMATEISIFIKDLYRLFKQGANMRNVADVFSSRMNFTALPVFGATVSDADSLRLLGEFYFKRGYCDDAIAMFEPLLAIMEESGEADEDMVQNLLEKLAYCYHKIGNVDTALKLFHKAELIDDGKLWLLKQLAGCYREKGNYSRALDYYRRAELAAPDNLNLNMQIGNMLLSLSKPAEAVKYYYKVAYLDEGNIKALRAVAWCEFMMHNFDKAIDNYLKITADKRATANDSLNLGHVYLAQGLIKEALASYRDYFSGQGGEGRALRLIKAFRDDESALKAAGVSAETLRFIIESILA